MLLLVVAAGGIRSTQQWHPMLRDAACTCSTITEGGGEGLSQDIGGHPSAEGRHEGLQHLHAPERSCAVPQAGRSGTAWYQRAMHIQLQQHHWDHHIASTCLNSSLMSSLWGSNKSKMRSHLAANQPQTSTKL